MFINGYLKMAEMTVGAAPPCKITQPTVNNIYCSIDEQVAETELFQISTVTDAHAVELKSALAGWRPITSKPAEQDFNGLITLTEGAWLVIKLNAIESQRDLSAGPVLQCLKFNGGARETEAKAL